MFPKTLKIYIGVIILLCASFVLLFADTKTKNISDKVNYINSVHNCTSPKCLHKTPRPTPVRPAKHVMNEDPFSELQLQYMCLDTNASSSNPHFGIIITNSGNSDFDMARLELRYWFNDDGIGGLQSAECTYVSLTYAATSDLVVSVIKNENCEQNKFISATFVNLDLVLEPGQEIEVHFGYSNSHGSQYNQSNDYSFSAEFEEPGYNQQINLVYNGAVLWGYQPTHIEPNNSALWIDGQILVRFDDTVSTADIVNFEIQYKLTGAGEAGGYNGMLYTYRFNDTFNVIAKVNQIKNDGRVKYSQPNYIYSPLSTAWKEYTPYVNPNDPAYKKIATAVVTTTPGIKITQTADQWGLRAICADSLSMKDGWKALGHGNSQINIGVLDTGVAMQRCGTSYVPSQFKVLCSDLDICNQAGYVQCKNSKVIGQKFTVYNQDVPDYKSCYRTSAFTQAPIGLNKADDDTGHGTHVTGIIGAVGNNNKLMAGMIWDYNRIYVSKITPPPVDFNVASRHRTCADCSWSPTMPILTTGGIRINGLCAPCGPNVLTVGHSTTSIIGNEILKQIKQNHADVINISFGSGLINEDYVLQEAIDYAYYYGRNGKGTLIIVAAGNNGAQVIQNPGSIKTGYFPAACDRVLVVSASDDTDHMAGFSNWRRVFV